MKRLVWLIGVVVVFAYLGALPTMAQKNSSWTPLMLAVYHGHADKDSEGWTPLWWAAYKGRADMAALLIAKEAKIDAKSNDGWTPLMVAAEKGHADIARLLIEKEVNSVKKQVVEGIKGKK